MKKEHERIHARRKHRQEESIIPAKDAQNHKTIAPTKNTNLCWKKERSFYFGKKKSTLTKRHRKKALIFQILPLEINASDCHLMQTSSKTLDSVQKAASSHPMRSRKIEICRGFLKRILPDNGLRRFNVENLKIWRRIRAGNAKRENETS